MQKPEVSIVTPSYNQAEFIEDNLDSVKNQTLNDLEHIVMDGNSTDGTQKILKDYENTYNLIWNSGKDNGQSDAINKGVEIAKGNIIGWLNSDDVYVDNGVLERVVEYFEEYPDVDILYGDLARMSIDSTIQSFSSRPNFRRWMLNYSHTIAQPSTFFRSPVISENPIDTDLQYIMDWEYWHRLSKNYRFKHVNDVFAAIRKYDAQKSAGQEIKDEKREVGSKIGIKQGLFPQIISSSIELSRIPDSLSTALNSNLDTEKLPFDGSVAPLPILFMNSALPSRIVWRFF